MQEEPGGAFLVEDELDVLVAAPEEGHHEGPGAARLAGMGIEHRPGEAEVHLGLFTGVGLDPHGELGAFWFQAAHEAPDGRVAAGVVVVIPEPLIDGLDLDPFLQEGDDDVPIGLNRRAVLRGKLRGHRFFQAGMKFVQGG